MKAAIIGAGNIGGALAGGIILKDIMAPENLTLTAAHSESLDRFKTLGCNLVLSNVEAVKDADIIFIAVKPWTVLSVLEEIKPVLDYKHQTITCLAAGLSSDRILPSMQKEDGSRPGFLYAIPNTAIEIGESVTFLAPVTADEAQLDAVRQIFDKLGKAVVVPESKLQAGTALASCGIAFAMRYARAAVLGGVELGFEANEALEIVEQTVIGAMSLMQAHSSHPEMEIDKVTTPGGITIKGLNAMEKAGFTTAVIEGLKASK